MGRAAAVTLAVETPRGDWFDNPVEYADVECAVERARAVTTGRWQVMRAGRVVAAGCVKRIDQQEEAAA